MGAVPEARVFSIRESTFGWPEVVAAARAWGDWQALEEQTRRALAVERWARENGIAPSREDLVAAANAFRYERGLLSVDELEQWAAHWGISTEDWLAHLRRSLLRPTDRLPEPDLAEEEVERATWLHAVCSGALPNLARRLAERAAVGARSGGGLLASPEELERFSAAHVTDEAIDAEIRGNVIGLTHVRCRYVVHDSDVVLREVALCVGEDARELADVAADAALEVREHGAYLDDTEPRLRTRLLAAGVGDVVGPVQVGDERWLAVVVERRPASTADAALRERVRAALRERALRAVVGDAVRWHEHL
jgi:hypothetical protein